MLICQESVLKFMKWMDAEIPPVSGVSGAETNRAVSVFHVRFAFTGGAMPLTRLSSMPVGSIFVCGCAHGTKHAE